MKEAVSEKATQAVDAVKELRQNNRFNLNNKLLRVNLGFFIDD